ncbi:phosphohistidine phosphatase [Sphingobacteriaceae bacterium]|nr:phosphohistidine phosphatase [Sphingobacteriaceae bacterium]
MKELIFVRHAKSDWGTEFLKDIDRHLNERGYRDAYFLSEWFEKNKKKPDLILSSSATRALSTAFIFARSLEQNKDKIKVEEKIYEASLETLLSVLKKMDASYNSVMLFGHNPSLTTICNYLCDDLFFDDIPTCGIVSYNFDIKKWSELDEKQGKLNYYQFPKEFKNKG